MRLLILGGGNNQLNGIKRAVQKGHEVVLTDYYPDAPGRAYAKYNEVVSTFDVEGNIEVAKKYSVDGVMTLGTDQPVYTVSRVASALNLPQFLDIDTAEAVTNKKIMKGIFTKHNLPTVKYRFLNQDCTEKDWEGMKFPVVLKPLDSQGQRGVYKLHSSQEIKDNIQSTLSFSRQREALLEEFYESDEITISAWVEKGIPHILTITDRETFQRAKHIGICFAHAFPSKHMEEYPTMKNLVDNITKAFGIKEGPLYVQLLVGAEGILINEIACRIGGAYEDLFIPYLTGVDILDRVIDFSLKGKMPSPIEPYCILENKKYLSTQLFFARAGRVKQITPVKELKKLPGLLYAGYNIVEGKELPLIENATARAGFMIIEGANKEELSRNINHAFTHLQILNEKNENLTLQYKIY